MRLFQTIFAVIAFFGLVNAGLAAEVKIENYSNNPVYVAQANNVGRTVSFGWAVIRPNETATFSAPDAADLYIRVQDKNGNAITFTNHKKFLDFSAHDERFMVTTEPDDSTVWVLKSGPELQNARNIKKGDKLPLGWTNRSFFAIGTGSHTLEIKP